jgi:hypothetical protein
MKTKKRNPSLPTPPARGVSRRNFLRIAGAGAVAATTAPWIWIPKKAFAATSPAFGTAEHVLVLYAGGGLRSAPLFCADVSPAHNPFGIAAGIAPGTQLSVGKLLGDQPFPLNTSVDPLAPVPAIASDITVIAGVDHEPSSATPPTDHGTGDTMLTQGMMNTDRGLLSIVHRDYAGYVNGTTVLPPFDIGLSNFAKGTCDFAGYRPIALQSAAAFTGKSATAGQEDRAAWTRDLRKRRDQAFIARRSPSVRPYLTAAMDAKINSRAYAAALHAPGLDLIGAPDASIGGLTNTQLLDVLGASQLAGTQNGWGLETAFALRLFQMGVPMATVLHYAYDDHSDEKTLLPVDALDLGRQIAGIHFLLHNLYDQKGQLLWDKTVVLVCSEFSRDNTDAATGFNSAMGSDHQGSFGSRNQCWPVFGGPITAKGKRLGGLDPVTMATVNGPATSVRSVMGTMLDLLGIPSANYWADPVVTGLFT